MKCQFFLECNVNGTMDLDVKMPFLKTLYPKSELKKGRIGFNEREYIIIKEIVEIKLVSYDESPCDIDMKVDFYMTEAIGYSFLDIQFDVTKEIAETILFPKLLFKSKMIFEGEKQDFANIIQKVLWSAYEMDKMMALGNDEKYVTLNKTDFQSIRQDTAEKFGLKNYHSGLALSGGMSSAPAAILLLDYKNELGDKWEEISTSGQGFYLKKDHASIFCLKEEKHYDDVIGFIIEKEIEHRIVSAFKNMCHYWLKNIGRKVDSIRNNIISQEGNKYYWQELKREIEVVDLNFLEFHTDACNYMMTAEGIPNTLDLTFSKEYVKDYLEKSRYNVSLVYKYLGEIKYAIQNLATPGHTHDEHLLQEETEITNERILLLSFLAMSIPMLGAIFSPEFSASTKIISAGVLFSLPVIYLIIMRIQKQLALKNNVKTELKRQYNSLSKILIKEKQFAEKIRSYDLIPEDLRETVISYHEREIENTEKRLSKLEKYK